MYTLRSRGRSGPLSRVARLLDLAGIEFRTLVPEGFRYDLCRRFKARPARKDYRRGKKAPRRVLAR